MSATQEWIKEQFAKDSPRIITEYSLQDQIDLAQCAVQAARQGATVIVSNHYNWYTKEIYKTMFGAKIFTLDVSRTISGTADKRSAVKELIAVFAEGNVDG